MAAMPQWAADMWPQWLTGTWPQWALAAASIAVWFGAYALCLLFTRPTPGTAEPATPDLGPEPPAIASLLVNRWKVTVDAAESTLLDLAARGYYEIRQPDNDPRHATIHLSPQAAADTLLPYERQVLDRVREVAVGGLVPLTALTFRNKQEEDRWTKELTAAVVEDARRRGLTRRRFSPALVTLLGVLGFVAAIPLAVVVAYQIPTESGGLTAGERFGTAAWTAFFVTCALAGVAGRYPGERDTQAGREVAGRWLGVRAWLAAHETFADLPPAAVAVWNRYLGYGAALGVTHTASAVIDLGMGRRELVWSSFGGAWHRVRVRYPRARTRYGKPTARLIFEAIVGIVLGALLIRFWQAPTATFEFLRERQLWGTDPWHGQGSFTLRALGIGLLAWGAYRLIRTLVDLATPRELTGEVLWMEHWRTTSGGKYRPPVTWLYYLAVDDGTADRTVAWGLPSEWTRRCAPGDIVQMRVRPWSRRVIELTMTRGSARYGLTNHHSGQ